MSDCPHRKGLLFQLDPAFLEHPEGVPGAVADGQNQVFGFDGLPVDKHPPEPAVLDGKPGELGLEQNLPALCDDFLPDGFDHFP